MPANLGRAGYASVLDALDQVQAGLGRSIHAGNGPKPLTCSNLFHAAPDGDRVRIEAQRPYFLRVTGLNATVSQALESGFLAKPPASWSLDGHAFQVTEVTCDGQANPWTGRATYEALAAKRLLADGRLDRSVRLRFTSPVAFKSMGKHVALPLPGLLFGSLVERWNAFSPVTVSGEMRRFADEMVAVSSFNLQSRRLAYKEGSVRIGGVGSATYHALGGDRYWVSIMQMLADFALFSGAGIHTTSGMGQVRRMEKKRGGANEEGSDG